jgi:hypothetical protein
MQHIALRSILSRFIFAAAALAGCGALQAQSAPPPLSGTVANTVQPRDAQEAFRQAVRLHRIGRWSAAYARFAELADQGHVPAARVALAMLQNGPRVYNTEWRATQRQVATWERAVGSADATYLVRGE